MAAAVQDLKHKLAASALVVAKSTSDSEESAEVAQAKHRSQIILAKVLSTHPVIKSGSIADIVEATQILDVLDYLDEYVGNAAPASAASATTSSSSASTGSNTAPSSSRNQQQQGTAGSTRPLPHEEANNLGGNALEYVSTIVGAVMAAHCSSPSDTSSLQKEPMASLRKLMVPRLRKYHLAPHPKIRMTAFRSIVFLTGIAAVPEQLMKELEELMMFEREPACFVVPRWIDAETPVNPTAMRALILGLKQCVAAEQQAHASGQQGTGSSRPIKVDFDYPTASRREVALCDACGRHNYFPMLR